MKKVVISTLLLCTIVCVGLAQKPEIVFNEKLFFQITKNQFVRLTSEHEIKKSYKKQHELYSSINRDIAKVLIVNQFIYDKLSKVDKTLKQGKKLKYFYKYVNKITTNGKELLILTKKNPEYAVLMTNTYNELIQECAGLVSEVNKSILGTSMSNVSSLAGNGSEDETTGRRHGFWWWKKKKKDKINISLKDNRSNTFMDAYDREIIIEKMLSKARLINGYILLLINNLKEAQNISYIKQIPVLKDYISLDKTIVEGIIYKWKNF